MQKAAGILLPRRALNRVMHSSTLALCVQMESVGQRLSGAAKVVSQTAELREMQKAQCCYVPGGKRRGQSDVKAIKMVSKAAKQDLSMLNLISLMYGKDWRGAKYFLRQRMVLQSCGTGGIPMLGLV